jgi:hypothetical protein
VYLEYHFASARSSDEEHSDFENSRTHRLFFARLMVKRTCSFSWLSLIALGPIWG